MMNIAFTCNNLNNGGAERVICNIANQMALDGHNVHLICYRVTESFYYELNDGVEIIQLDPHINMRNFFISRKIAGIVNLFKLCDALKWSDTVISFYTRQNCYSIIVCKLIGVPIICSERDHFFLNDGLINHTLRRLCYPLSDGFIHQTKAAQEWLRANEGVKCKDIVIPNPLWIENFPERKPVKGYVIAVGRLEEQKNYKELIDAFITVKRQIPYAELHIFGDGPQRKELQQYINSKDLNDTVFLEGITKDIISIYAKSEVFVMFSHGEGYPNALMEALAMGVPCISSDCPVGGPKDMIENGYNGFLVPCSDTDQLALKIITLLTHSNIAIKFSKNAKQIRETNKFPLIYKTIIKYLNKINKDFFQK